MGSVFSFLVVPQGWGLRLGYNNHRCPVSSPRLQSTVWSVFSTLRICAQLELISHLTLHPFDQSMRCTEWDQIAFSFLPLCWLGHCTCKVPALSTSVPLLKKALCVPLPLWGFFGFPHSPTLWTFQSPCGSWPVTAHRLFQLQVWPRSPQFSGNVLGRWLRPQPQY